jgi:hypothetical protein
MKRLILALALVAMGTAACKKADQASQTAADTTHMMADSTKMAGDTTHMMAPADSSKKH